MPDFNRPPLMTHLRPESHLPSVSHCPPHLSPSIFAQTVQQPQTLLTVPPLHPTGVEQRTLEHGRTQLRDATRGNAKRKLPRTSSLVFIINLLAKMKNETKENFLLQKCGGPIIPVFQTNDILKISVYSNRNFQFATCRRFWKYLNKVY